jgi:hypothetical protein
MTMHEAFVEAFVDQWAAPSEQKLRAILSEDVRLVHPIAKPTLGIDAAVKWLSGILVAISARRRAPSSWSSP